MKEEKFFQLQEHSLISRKLIFTGSITQVCIVMKLTFYINSMKKLVGEKSGSRGRYIEFTFWVQLTFEFPW